MSAVRSALSREQEKQLGSLLGHARLSLLYKGSVHGYTAAAFHARCDRQGPTVVVAYNKAGFIFGGFTSKDYTQCGQDVADDKAFLFGFREGDGRKSPLRIEPNSKDKAFHDWRWGPDFKRMHFLSRDQALVYSYDGPFYSFKEEEMHGGDLVMTEFEAYRVEDLGGLLEKPWRNVLWSSDLRPTMSAVRSALSHEQEKQLGSLLGHARLSLLYKGSVHGYTAAAFHARCDRQGPTVVVAYNGAGFVFGGFTSKDYTQCGQDVADDKAFLFGFREGDGGKSPLRIEPNSKDKAFHDWRWGPDFKRLHFLSRDQALVYSYDGPFYSFKEEEMHGGDLVMTEFEAYRVEGSAGSKAGAVGGAWICVDMAYVPSGPASSMVDAEFFRCVRSSYYVISGAEPGEGVGPGQGAGPREGAEPGQGAVLRSILDALLEGKARWPSRAQVTVIPTFNSPVIQEWYRETREQQEGLDVTVLGCSSTVAMQDEVFPACKLEF